MKQWNVRVQLGCWAGTVPITAKTAQEAHRLALDGVKQQQMGYHNLLEALKRLESWMTNYLCHDLQSPHYVEGTQSEFRLLQRTIEDANTLKLTESEE